jgi:hypothetical protein
MSTKVSDVDEARRAAPAPLRAEMGAQAGKFTPAATANR